MKKLTKLIPIALTMLLAVSITTEASAIVAPRNVRLVQDDRNPLQVAVGFRGNNGNGMVALVYLNDRLIGRFSGASTFFTINRRFLRPNRNYRVYLRNKRGRQLSARSNVIRFSTRASSRPTAFLQSPRLQVVARGRSSVGFRIHSQYDFNRIRFSYREVGRRGFFHANLRRTRSGVYYIGNLRPGKTYGFTIQIFDRQGRPSNASTQVYARVGGARRIASLENNNEVTESAVIDVKAYPNPTTNNLTVEVPIVDGGWKYQITNISGQALQQGTINTSSTPLSLVDLGKGLYFLQLNSATETKTIRVVKQ